MFTGEIRVYKIKEYGTHKCSCGCGTILGRATNGTDGKPIDWSVALGRTDDVEGMEWRVFTPECYMEVESSIDEMYCRFRVPEEVQFIDDDLSDMMNYYGMM